MVVGDKDSVTGDRKLAALCAIVELMGTGFILSLILFSDGWIKGGRGDQPIGTFLADFMFPYFLVRGLFYMRKPKTDPIDEETKEVMSMYYSMEESSGTAKKEQGLGVGEAGLSSVTLFKAR